MRLNDQDKEWALDVYRLFARHDDEERLFYLAVPGEPWSKRRPRFNAKTGRSYSDKKGKSAEVALAWRFKEAGARTFTGNVMLACRFYRSSRQPVDADNLLKHVCDAGTGHLWNDDAQVTLTVAEVHMDADQPRTIIMVGEHDSTMKRGTDRTKVCVVCGKDFIPEYHARKYCSKACVYASRGEPLTTKKCEHCGVVFKPRNRKSKLCSEECRAARLRNRQKKKAKPKSKCEECGKQLSHSRGGRCRSCWRANPWPLAGQEDNP